MELFVISAMVVYCVSLLVTRALLIKREDRAKALLSFLFVYSILITIIFMIDDSVLSHQQYIVHVSAIWSLAVIVTSTFPKTHRMELLLFFIWLMSIFITTLAT